MPDRLLTALECRVGAARSAASAPRFDSTIDPSPMRSLVPFRLRARVLNARRSVQEARFFRTLNSCVRDLGPPAHTSNPKHVVFNTVRAHPSNLHLITDFYLAHQLARAGCQATLLLDDGVMEHWDTAQHQNCRWPHVNPMRSPTSARNFKRGVAKFARAFAHPGVKVIWYSELLRTPARPPLTATDEDHARSSLIRYFESGVVDLSSQAQLEYLETCRLNARHSRALGEAVASLLKPDVFITSHGIYSTWGPARQATERAGIATHIYMIHPYRLGGILLNDAAGGTINHTIMEDFVANGELTQQQALEVQTYLTQRQMHQASDTGEYFANLKARPAAADVEHASAETTFGLFPNVPWDAVGEHLQALYPGVIDWIVDTARQISRLPNSRLVIRLHPGEATRLKNTTQTLDTLTSVAPDIRGLPNLRLILPEEGVDSYKLLRDSIDVALVYTGTLGAEAQLQGVPVVAVAKGRFSKRFTTQPESVAEYHDLLYNPVPILRDFEERREEIQQSILKYHFLVNTELFHAVPMLSAEHRGRASTTGLRAHRLKLPPEQMQRTVDALLGARPEP
jgi:hypothetical protein